MAERTRTGWIGTFWEHWISELVSGDQVLGLGAHNVTCSIPGAIHVITPQPQESGYWTKVLTNTFGLANCGRRLFLRGRPGLRGLHQPKVGLGCSAANIGPCEGIDQYHRLIDSSPPFWLNQKCPQRRRRNWVASPPETNMNVSQRYSGAARLSGLHSTLKEQNQCGLAHVLSR